MTTNYEQFQILLLSLTNAFLDELPERCHRIEDLVLALEKTPNDRETFNELYREVHSVKGSGGTHGLKIVTSICHQLENDLTEADTLRRFDAAFTARALAYVDLLSRVQPLALEGHNDFSELENELEKLRQKVLRNRKAGLIAESSALMVNLYQEALKSLPVQLTVATNGLQALDLLLHENFDFVIVGRELKDLNGLALMTALRVAQARNHKIPAVLVSSKRDGIPDAAEFKVVLLRNQKLSESLRKVVQETLE